MRHLLLGVALLLSVAVWADSAALEVKSHPSGLRVFINSHCKGVTPVRVTLGSVTTAAQTYEVRIVGQGFVPWVLEVKLKSGDNKAVSAYPKRETVGAKPPLTGRQTGKVVCLDPGHPSETSGGTKGKHVTENRINWLVALKLASLLEARGVRVVMTKKSEQEKVTNRRRAEIANEAQANLMVRLHCDAASKRGLGVYAPDRQGTKFGVTGPSKDIITRSQAAAKRFYAATMAALGKQLPGRGVRGDSATYVGSQQGALTGSIFSKVPVVTVEMVVLTMAEDEAFIRADRGQDAMAKALLAGVEAVLGNH